MPKLKDLLRLKFEAGLSHRDIARSLSISPSSVSVLTRQALAAGLSWPLPDDLSEAELEAQVFGSPEPVAAPRKTEPDFAVLHQELKRKGVTLQLLWEEYGQTAAKPYAYSQFCARYHDWRGQQRRSMRQCHRAGEKLFVDYAGQTLSIVDPNTGELRTAQVFVAVLGASNYTYAEATWSQGLPDWVGSHSRAFAFFGGVPELVVPDNLKSGVSKACRYEPDLNPTYAQMAAHYGVAVMPARPYKPKDKAKAEVGVQIVERWLLARLRKDSFFSLAQLNARLAELLADLNARPFQRLPGCRRSAFEALDQPALKPLPAIPYEYTEVKRARVHIDYHVEVDGHYYSVPHALIKAQVEVQATASAVRILHRGHLVACHARSSRRGAHSTDPAHMPKAHRAHQEWSPARLIAWGKDIGPATGHLVQHLLEHKPHPEQGYRACLGLLSLAKRYRRERLEAACVRALAVGTPNRHSVDTILAQGLDRLPLPAAQQSLPLPEHDHVRGPGYYH